jgi:hypothetical protein
MRQTNHEAEDSYPFSLESRLSWIQGLCVVGVMLYRMGETRNVLRNTRACWLLARWTKMRLKMKTWMWIQI